MMKRLLFVLLALTGPWISISTSVAETTGQYLELPTVNLWLVDSGGSGETIILLHPGTSNSEFWQNTIPAVAEVGYRAIAIDNPGWGRSMVKEGWKQNPVPVAETIEALLDSLGLDQVHVVGAAMGGTVALDFAASRPERTRTLTIATSGLGLEGDPEYETFRERAEIPGMRQQSPVYRVVSPNYRVTKPEGVEQWLEIYNNSQQEGAVRPPLINPNTPKKLASINVPTLVIAGGIDLVTPSGAMRLYSRHLTAPNEFHVVPEAGHVLVWEQPDVFNQMLIEFMSEH